MKNPRTQNQLMVKFSLSEDRARKYMEKFLNIIPEITEALERVENVIQELCKKIEYVSEYDEKRIREGWLNLLSF